MMQIFKHVLKCELHCYELKSLLLLLLLMLTKIVIITHVACFHKIFK